MAIEITIRFTVGDKTLQVAAPPESIGNMVNHHTGGRLMALFDNIVNDSLARIDVMAIMRIFESDPAVLEYLSQILAVDREAEAMATEAASALIMTGVAGGKAAAWASG